jgi:hypothetical protein
MDADLKQKWVTALRNGEFKQAKNALHQYSGGYCCLGVLALVWNRGDIIETADYEALDAIVGGLSTRNALTHMNDKAGKSFPEIADWIEANIPAVSLAQDK